MNAAERLLNESRELISVVNGRRSDIANYGDQIPAAPSLDEQEIVQRTTEDQVDGTVAVSISDDEMTGFISIYPPQGFGRALGPTDVYERLADAGVVFGIQSELVEASLFVCNTERVSLFSVEVAFGLPPRHRVPQHHRLLERPSRDVHEHGTDRVNYRAFSDLPLVHAGDALAVIEPETEGRDGTTVTGGAIPHPTRKTRTYTHGPNVETAGETVLATISGVLHIEQSVISVSPTLTLLQGVDYHTGNIAFDGDVVLRDRVADGFTVACTGALIASVTIDAFGISCGTLSSCQGVIGHNGGEVSVTTDASLRFVQNARIRVGGTIRVAQSVLKSHITAHDRVELAHGSLVVGSTIRAGLGAVVFHIGRAGSAASEVFLGIDFSVDERLATIRDQTLALSRKLHEVRIAEVSGEQAQHLRTVEHELQAAIGVLAEEAGELVTQLDRDEDATLVVHGTMHAGTYIEICHRSHIVERTIGRCVIRLDRKTGTIVTEPLGKQGRGRST